MEAFPADYVTHNLPLLLLSGLGHNGKEHAALEAEDRSTILLQEGGFRIRTEAPLLTNPAAENLVRAFLAFDSTTDDFNGNGSSMRESPGAFTIRRVGRAYALPPRKASPPPHAPRYGPLSGPDSTPPPLSLHSTISPLTPSSPLFPDGIITPLWITKHQSCLPAVFIVFFALTADPNTSSLRDNQIKQDIGNVRGVFSSTNCKTKVVVILVGEPGTNTPFDLDERLGSIRRATGLDSKHLFFLSAEASTEATLEFVKTILASLQTFCVEYYRDLSKHTRRKKNRSSIPPPTAPPTFGTSQTLPSQGWNVRYEFKLGVFAEFRQEMDAAYRNYESAYEGLFSHELFETTSSWNPRFNEARLLADAIALRLIRCLLWTSQPTSAARFWTKHRSRTRDLVNIRGKGSENYGWEAWETVWSKSFAQLVTEVKKLKIAVSDSQEVQDTRPQFFPPEKSIPVGERYVPWELLHHEGYWLNKAWRHTHKRRILSHQLPEEDRRSPGQSPASAIANRSHLYDTYLVLEPHLEFPLGSKKGYDYSVEIVKTIQSATRSFSNCRQNRFVEQLRLEEAKEQANEEQWHDALETIRSIWPCLSWRQAGWWKMVVEAARTFREAAKQTSDAETLLRLDWEAHSSAIPLSRNWRHDLHKSLEEIDTPQTKPSVVLQSDDALSPVWASLQFASPEGNVGETLKAQLVLVSTAHRGSAPIHLSEVKIVFEGGLRPIRLLSSDFETPVQAPAVVVSELQLRESSSPLPASDLVSLFGVADITMQPGQRKVLNMTCIPREAGDVKVASVALVCEASAFSFTYVINHQITSNAKWWSLKGVEPRSRQLRRDGDASVVRILPKPPKIRIDLPNLKHTYYLNEKISLPVVIRNEETDTANVSISARLRSSLRNSATIRWEGITKSDSFELKADKEDSPSHNFLSLSRHTVGSIPSAGSGSLTFVMDRTQEALQHELELTVDYQLINDPETPLTKTFATKIRISRPFEANYELLPRLDSTTWPSFFDPQATATGLSQRFVLVSKIVSFVTEPVVIEGVSLGTQKILGNAVCEISEEKDQIVDQTTWNAGEGDGTMAPEGLRVSSFDILVRKNALGDPHSVALDLILMVQWRRSPDKDLVISSLEVPRYIIPMSEPRVLLSKQAEMKKKHANVVQVQYTIENPSMHYLTFNLTMESSDEFAFSGPKATSFSLVPVSRHVLNYRILARQRAKWIRLRLEVKDAYFSKTLRVSPAGEGIRSDGRRGLLVWVE